MVYKKSQKKNVPSAHFTKLVKKVVQKQAEHKYKEAQVASLAFDALPTSATIVSNLETATYVAPSQGTAADQRIGDRIRCLSLDFNAVFVPTVATTGAVRIIIGQVIDQQAHAVMTLPYNSILTGLTGAADYSCITASYDHEPLVEYRILSDDVITWDATNAAAPRLIQKHFTNLAVKNRNFEGATAQSTGTFFYMFLSANGVAASFLRPYAKLTWVDL